MHCGVSLACAEKLGRLKTRDSVCCITSVL
uniref:Uncharacterized protein n=1 Tax=Rhizophora mucronata TaxID=61149 RepID=A0A2P2NZA3_RHIMU